MTSQADAAFSRETRSRVNAVLRARFGSGARADEAEPLTAGRPRSTVFRCRVDGGSAPPSVIVKVAKQGDSLSHAFENEWAALALLSEEGPGPRPVAPLLYGGDLRARLLVLEDLGDGPSLADLLLGEDPIAADAALFAYSTSLGRLHARSAGKVQAFEAKLRSLGAPADTRGAWQAEVRRVAASMPQAFADFDFMWTPALIDEVQAIAATLLEPGPFFALGHGDPCPENNRLLGEEMRHFGFEVAGFRHALLDGVYPLAPFPTCWCTNRLPQALVQRLQLAYRLELAVRLPEAEDAEAFARLSVEAAAYWLLRSAADGLFARARRANETWGIATIRQRCLHRLGTVATLAAEHGHLPALGAFAARLHHRLRALWPDVPEMPLYPALRNAPPDAW